MSLPVIVAPKFKLILPSTGKSYTYRPFLVKEEKILLIALESGSVEDMIAAIKDIIKACVTDIDVDTLAIFDLEYIFLRLREKSIGENIKMLVHHINNINSKEEPCDHVQEITIKLPEVDAIKDPKHSKKIQLTDDIGVVMKYPTPNLIELMNEDDKIISVIENCIESIYDADTVYPTNEALPGEVSEFVGNLSHQQLEMIQEFFITSPVIKHEVKWICSKCKSEESITLEGLEDFFG